MHSLPGGGGESVNCMDNTGIMWGKQYHCISHVYIIYRDMLDSTKGVGRGRKKDLKLTVMD